MTPFSASSASSFGRTAPGSTPSPKREASDQKHKSQRLAVSSPAAATSTTSAASVAAAALQGGIDGVVRGASSKQPRRPLQDRGAAKAAARHAAQALPSGVERVGASVSSDLHADMVKTQVDFRGLEAALRDAAPSARHPLASTAAAAAGAALRTGLKPVSEAGSARHRPEGRAEDTRHPMAHWLLEFHDQDGAPLPDAEHFAASYRERPVPELAHELFVMLRQIGAQEFDAATEDRLEPRFEGLACALCKAMPMAAKTAFADQVLRLFESDSSCARVATTPRSTLQLLYQVLFSALGQSARPDDLPTHAAFEDALKRRLLDSPCGPHALALRSIAVTSFYDTIAPAAQDALAVAVVTAPRSQFLTREQDLALRGAVTSAWKDSSRDVSAAIEAVPMPTAGPDRSFAINARASAYRHLARTSLMGLDGLRLLDAVDAAVEAYTHAPEQALAQALHDVRPARLMGLCEEVVDSFRSGLDVVVGINEATGRPKRGLDLLAVVVEETASLPLPARHSPELRGQILELRGLAIACLMRAGLKRSLADFLTARLPADAIARDDALDLRSAVWRELGMMMTATEKRQLFASGYAYDLTFAGHPAAERRVLRTYLCDALFAFDRSVCADTLVLDLARMNKNQAPLERRLDGCADLLHIDVFRLMANPATARRAFDEMLAACADIGEVATRAHRLLDLARAAGPFLTAPLFDRMRVALVSPARLAFGKSAESKAEGSGQAHESAPDSALTSALASVPQATRAVDFKGARKMIFHTLSPANRITFLIRQTGPESTPGGRAQQLLSLFEEFCLADDLMLGPDAMSQAFFKAQVDAVMAYDALTQLEKNSIASALRSLRIDYNAME